MGYRKVTQAAAARLFIVGPASRPDDALDVVSAAAPALSQRYREVRRVTLGAADGLSLRGLRRSVRPGSDRVLYDFTQADVAAWAGETARTSSGAILSSAAPLPSGDAALNTLRRSRRRYGGLAHGFFAPGRMAALDADLPGGIRRLARPAITIPRPPFTPPPEYACAAICAPDGSAEAYGVIRAWIARRAASPGDHDNVADRLLVSVATPQDAAEAHRYRTYLGAQDGRHMIDIEVRSHRADLGGIALRSAMLIDLDRFSWPGRTDVFAVADALARPRVRLTGPLAEIAAEARAALRSPPAIVAQPTLDASGFAAQLFDFIETAQTVTTESAAYFGAFA